MGVFSLDINKPIELILDKEPGDDFRNAISRFSAVPA